MHTMLNQYEVPDNVFIIYPTIHFQIDFYF